MIRDYEVIDRDEIVRLYTLEYFAMPDEIESLRTASKILVYEDQGVKGFIRLALSGNSCYIEMGALSNAHVHPVGLELWEESKKVFAQNSIKSANVFHVKDNLHWKQLFDTIGFNYWYSVHRFSYDGPKFKEPIISVVKYEDHYFEEKIRLESEAFSFLRKDNDIKPYNWYLSATKEALENARKSTLEDKKYIYLFFEDDVMVGASMVKNAEIDLLFVNVKFQGQGIGQKILKYTINRGLEQDETGVFLNALASNDEALKLYKKIGFKDIQAQDARRISL